VADDRVERAFRVLRRAEVSQPHVGLAPKLLNERRRQPRLANARLTREQDDPDPRPPSPWPRNAASAWSVPRVQRGRSGPSRAAPRNGSPGHLRILCWKGLGADSEEKHEPASDIDTAVADSLKALDLKRPIREADIFRGRRHVSKVPNSEVARPFDWFMTPTRRVAPWLPSDRGYQSLP
jgi:hypothetical protein